MRDTRSLLAGIAASSALVAAATLALLTASAIVAFHGWPGAGSDAGSPIALPAVPAQAVSAPAQILVPAAARGDLRATVRRASSSLRRRSASSAAATPRRIRRTAVRTPAARPRATTSTPATPPALPAQRTAPVTLSAPATPSVPAAAPHVAPATPGAPPAPGSVDQVAETTAGAPQQAPDAVAGSVSPPPPLLAAGDPR